MDNKFDILSKIDVGDEVKQKGKYNYLSWVYAVRELLQVAPDATWEIHEYEGSSERGITKQPYMRTNTGYYVKVTVTVNGIDRTQIHPVLDHSNKTSKEPNAFQVNTSIQRCLTKAIALHGLGLYIYAGEDLPRDPDPLNDKQRTVIKKLCHILKDTDAQTVKNTLDSLKNDLINETNYEASVIKLERLTGTERETNNE